MRIKQRYLIYGIYYEDKDKYKNFEHLIVTNRKYDQECYSLKVFFRTNDQMRGYSYLICG
jgi:hypothetical protein